MLVDLETEKAAFAYRKWQTQLVNVANLATSAKGDSVPNQAKAAEAAVIMDIHKRFSGEAKGNRSHPYQPQQLCPSLTTNAGFHRRTRNSPATIIVHLRHISRADLHNFRPWRNVECSEQRMA